LLRLVTDDLLALSEPG
jgi:hypothetical protein